MQTEVHEYDGGGVRSRGYLALPGGTGKAPGVLVVHEAPGLDAHPKRRADMLAKLGYVALAADLYGGGVVGEGPQEAFKLMGPLRDDADLLRRRMRASFDALASVANVDQKRLAAIGYCFGGMSVLELARSGAPAAGVVSFHGLLKTERPAPAGEVKAKILVCTGSADPLVPAEQVVEFESGNDQGRNRLAGDYLWRRQARLHQHRGRWHSDAGLRLFAIRRRPVMAGDAELFQRGVWGGVSLARSCRWRRTYVRDDP